MPQQEIQSSHLSNVAISFLTQNKKGQTLITDTRKEKYTYSSLPYSELKVTWRSLLSEPAPKKQTEQTKCDEKERKKDRKKTPTRNSPPVRCWPCCFWSSSSWLGANNPAHLMSRLGKARWLVDLIIRSYCVIWVVQKRWVLSLLGPVQEISATLAAPRHTWCPSIK